MADQVDIDMLRRATGIMDDTEPYTDEALSALLDSLGFNIAAAQLWEELAAKYSTAVDMSESGSSRSLSQLHRNALTMAGRYRELENQDVGTTRKSSYTVGIERP